MTDPLVFDGASPRFGLPFLSSGQAQKEFYVNEAFAITDALMHCAIEAEATIPPSAPVNGTNWRIAAGAQGEWSGKSGQIACRQNGNWLYIAPRDGMVVFNRASGQSQIYAGSWKIPGTVAVPAGGSIVDAEARAAIGNLITALKTAGILA